MPGSRTEVTEIVTALGTLGRSLEDVLTTRPSELINVPDRTWSLIADVCAVPAYAAIVEPSFANGFAFFEAEEGLRGRVPLRVEWKGPHRAPGDDVVPADIRVDHVFQISCKYLSKILQNCGPARLFDRNLVGERRSRADWFDTVAPAEYQAFYRAIRSELSIGLPSEMQTLTASDRLRLKEALRPRALPAHARDPWQNMCRTVSQESATRWRANLTDRHTRLRTLWRLLRIGDAPYFILGTARQSQMRLRVASAWDWMQDFELRQLVVEPREAGQPEVAWFAEVLDKAAGSERLVEGHVEIRWSHGRFQGSPEAKIYLDTPHAVVPGFFDLA
jgi:hypothetical protein